MKNITYDMFLRTLKVDYKIDLETVRSINTRPKYILEYMQLCILSYVAHHRQMVHKWSRWSLSDNLLHLFTL